MKQQYTTLDEFEPWELEAYLDGEALPHVAEFLARNPDALAALRQEQAHSRRLQKALYRFDCPSPLMLQSYHWKELSATAHRQLAAHLEQCPFCSAEVAALQTFISEPTPVTQQQAIAAAAQSGLLEQLQGWLDQLRVVVATLITPGGPQMAGVALRSTATAAPRMYLFEADNTDVSLRLQKEQTGAYRVDGQVFATTPFVEMRYALTSAAPDAPPLTGTINDTGTFTMIALPPGTYQLVLKSPDRAIVVPNIILL